MQLSQMLLWFLILTKAAARFPIQSMSSWQRPESLAVLGRKWFLLKGCGSNCEFWWHSFPC